MTGFRHRARQPEYSPNISRPDHPVKHAGAELTAGYSGDALGLTKSGYEVADLIKSRILGGITRSRIA